jgi:hypothetical protein
VEKRKPRRKKEAAAKKTERESFYDKLFDAAEKIDFDRACGVEGIDDEIALIRLEIVKVVSGGDAANLRLLVQATNALERLIRTRYEISRDQRKSIREAIGNVLREIAVPLGITVGTEFLTGKVH